MQNQLTRTALLLGDKAMEKIANATIAVFGVGGVGGYVVEALARSGVSHFVLVDSDTVSITNINRIGNQIGFTDIIKSYLFCKNFKTKLLDICHEYILEEFCIDRILKRLFKLEGFYNKKIYKIKENNFRMQKNFILY